MRHEPFETRLHELLDRRQRPEECHELRTLAELSPACRELLAAQQRLFDGLEADEIPELPADFAERVVGEHCAAQREVNRLPAKRSRGTWVWELAAVSALVLAVIGGNVYLTAPSGQRTVVAQAANEHVPKTEHEATTNERQGDDVPAVTNDPVVNDTLQPSNTRAVEENAQQAAARTAAANQRYDELLHAFLERLPNRRGQEDLLALRPQWVDEVALGLRPVATSFGGAINTLRSTLPSNKSDHPDKPQAGMLDGVPMSGLA